MLTLKAPAKINLVLEVLGKRDDGYHEIRSIMQTIGLCDKLGFERSDEIDFTCTVKGLENESNLAFRAAVALKQAAGCTAGARISLDKVIPLEAGLGGGSSDAAAALVGLNRLWQLGLSRERLAEIGAGLGSDVPFFLYGGTCEVRGRGETVTVLPERLRMYFVLARPPVRVDAGKTGRMYSLLTADLYSDGSRCGEAAAAVSAGKKLELADFYNSFDAVAMDAYGALEACCLAFRQAGAAGIHLAGSGPTLFTATYNEAEAVLVHGKLISSGVEPLLAGSLNRSEI